MNIFRIFNVAGAGMSAQRTRMSVVAGNLANAETTRTPEGGPYRRRNVFFRALPLPNDFPSLLQAHSSLPLQLRSRDPQTDVNSVEVVKVQASTRAPRKVYDPQHPDADTEGYVSYPDINTMEEMTDLLSATRSYEANLTTFNATKALVRKLLEMGRL
ncbi:MAG: flagellar basal body rod protein FlgC [Candidatus Binatia bacterium]